MIVRPMTPVALTRSPDRGSGQYLSDGGTAARWRGSWGMRFPSPVIRRRLLRRQHREPLAVLASLRTPAQDVPDDDADTQAKPHQDHREQEDAHHHDLNRN